MAILNELEGNVETVISKFGELIQVKTWRLLLKRGEGVRRNGVLIADHYRYSFSSLFFLMLLRKPKIII